MGVIVCRKIPMCLFFEIYLLVLLTYLYTYATSRNRLNKIYKSLRIVPIQVIPVLLPSLSQQQLAELQIVRCTAIQRNAPLRSKSNIDKAFRDYSFSICILAHRGKKALRKALESWEKSGLMDLAEEKILFLQEWKHDEINDNRLDGDIENTYGLTIIGEEEQIGIARGLYKLVERSMSDFVLFLEEDFRISDDIMQDGSRAGLKKMIESEMSMPLS